MNILIVDPHPLYIRGLQSLLLELDPALQTRGTQSLRDAIRIARSSRSQLMLLNLDLLGASERDGLREVKRQVGSIGILALSSRCNSKEACSAIGWGAAGCLHKDGDPTTIMLTVQRVLDRQPARALAPVRGRGSRAVSVAPLLPTSITSQLTDRQHSVLLRLLQGKSNKAIARELQVADGTVKAHLSAVYRTLGVTSRLQAMSRAHELTVNSKPEHFAVPTMDCLIAAAS